MARKSETNWRRKQARSKLGRVEFGRADREFEASAILFACTAAGFPRTLNSLLIIGTPDAENSIRTRPRRIISFESCSLKLNKVITFHHSDTIAMSFHSTKLEFLLDKYNVIIHCEQIDGYMIDHQLSVAV